MASYNHKALFHQWIVNVGHSFMEYAKQASYKCLKNLFVWASFKNNWVYENLSLVPADFIANGSQSAVKK